MLKYDFWRKSRVKIIKNGLKTESWSKTGWKVEIQSQGEGFRLSNLRTEVVA